MSSIHAPAIRIASLLPAATEIVAALGLADRLVGVSHECDFPSTVRTLPILTRSRLEPLGASGAIDERVKSAAIDALGVYQIDVAELARLAPDVILTQDLCEVCAVPFSAVERALRDAGLTNTKIVSSKPTTLGGVWDEIARIANELGVPERGIAVVQALEARIAAIARRANRMTHRPRVLTIEWIDPVMIGGMWMPELIELAHATALVGRVGQHAPTLTAKELSKLSPAPEIVLIKPCGFTLPRSLMEVAAIDALFAPLHWPAQKNGEVFLADGSAYFNRPGPRLVESLEILAACVHPFEFRDLAAKHAHSYTRLARRASVA